MMPDKIYVSRDPFGFMSAYATENHPQHVEEYIRKDALLEYLNKCKDNPVFTELQKGNIQELIDKINSL